MNRIFPECLLRGRKPRWWVTINRTILSSILVLFYSNITFLMNSVVLQLVYATEQFRNGFHGTIPDWSRMVLMPVYTAQKKFFPWVLFLMNSQHIPKTHLFQWKHTKSIGSIHRTYFMVVGARSIDRWISLPFQPYVVPYVAIVLFNRQKGVWLC